ncbi:PucR family transcriptional regulator [Deinococcus sp. HMF7620]|uniref:PucR family transcriptional regulator n=1 Tax=Deinococcus arboris TaxID=2682977 RepID=A0A7C9I2D7_9DEIO|nr:PucR family transcriptional regulator [Deinococcus arboris]MVN86431.1 PucR family transcriptional regulator [Deinococcus arboris]
MAQERDDPASALPGLLAHPALGAALTALQAAAVSALPETALVDQAVHWTGGYAEIRASWGDVVASAGRAAGPLTTQRLEHAGRHVGTLVTGFPTDWVGLQTVLAGYALLARLQAAAAGAARRRVGERALDALLSGQDARLPGDGPFALAAAVFAGPETAALSAQKREQALDVLAGAGEGYFQERRLLGHSTVRGDLAVWLWRSLDLNRETQELRLALVASAGRSVRLGVSARSAEDARSAAVGRAFRQARQALRSVATGGGAALFQQMDPLSHLLDSGALSTVREQVQLQLSALGDGGRVEGTLRRYLACGGTLTTLAQETGLHVNTVRARLKRAEEALGAPLHDPALLARLYLAFASTETSGDELELGSG